MARNSRKQRVALRFRRREQIKSHVRVALVRGVVLSLVIGFAAGLVATRNSILLRFLHHHTPQAVIKLPQTLPGLPVSDVVPQNHLWLWVPGEEWWIQRKLTRQFTSVHSVYFERQFAANAVVIHVMPRVPLVTWNGMGFDKDGVLFALTPGTWQALPQVAFNTGASKPDLGHWLARLQQMTALWSQIASVRQDAYGTLVVTFKTGAVVIWGAPEPGSLAKKSQTLLRVLDDAHQHLGGMASADLRFFDQGRIIVRPKSSH